MNRKRAIPGALVLVGFLAFEVIGQTTREYYTISQIYSHLRVHHPKACLGVFILTGNLLCLHLALGDWNKPVDEIEAASA